MNLFSKMLRVSALLTLGAVLIFETGCGDTFRPIANPIIAPSGDPKPGGAITIINCNGTPSRSGPLTSCVGTAHSNAQQVNVSGDTLTNSFDIGVAPGFTSYDQGNSFFYVPNTSTDSVTGLNAQLTNPTTITVPVGSNPIAAFPGTAQNYVLNAGSGAVCPNLSVIGSATLAIASSYCIGSSPSFVTQIGNNVFVLDKALNQVNVFSTQQGKFIATVAVGTTPVWVTPSYDLNFLYVLNQGSSDITIVDANAFTAVATVPTGGSGPVTGYLDKKLIRFYVVNEGSNSVTAFNALGYSTLTLVGSAAVGPAPVDATVLIDGTRAYVANSGNNTLTEINTSSFTTKSLAVGTDPSALVTDVASSADGTKVVAATVTSGNLKNGVTIIRTTDDVVTNNLASSKQDPNCNVSVSTCPLQVPQQFIGGH
jgi:YVTN family beta-propeller protein